jgi:hypothetical protein
MLGIAERRKVELSEGMRSRTSKQGHLPPEKWLNTLNLIFSSFTTALHIPGWMDFDSVALALVADVIDLFAALPVSAELPECSGTPRNLEAR